LRTPSYQEYDNLNQIKELGSIKMLNFLKHTSFQTLLSIVIVFLAGDYFSLEVARSFYTISIILKDILLAFLPVAVFAFIASSLMQFKKQSVLVVFLVLIIEAISNAFVSTLGYGYSFILNQSHTLPILGTDGQSLESYFSFYSWYSSFWRVEYGVIAGALLGITQTIFPLQIVQTLLLKLRQGANFFLSKMFVPILPIFVFGLFLSLYRSGLLQSLLQNGGKIFFYLVVGLLGYLLFILLVAAKGNIFRAWAYLKNILPAGLVAATSMSSLATMPLTIEVTRKNLNHPSLADMLIPATTNIQQVGDCFVNIFLACGILLLAGQGLPSPSVFFTFLWVYVLARYSTAAVIGGAIFITLPLYQSYLGFNQEMSAMLIALNIVLDPLVTSSNVLGNSILCIIYEKIMAAFSSIRQNLLEHNI
jgi:Na+/H+-dicarboxylate symporter